MPPVSAPAPLEMHPGDVFALISDGFFEYHNGAGEQFGRQRVGELIRANRRRRPEPLIEALREEIRRFAGDAPQEDDMTALAVRRTI